MAITVFGIHNSAELFCITRKSQRVKDNGQFSKYIHLIDHCNTVEEKLRKIEPRKFELQCKRKYRLFRGSGASGLLTHMEYFPPRILCSKQQATLKISQKTSCKSTAEQLSTE